MDYTYTPDFRVLTPNESDEALAYFIETKGYFRPEDRRTLKAVREQNKAIDLRILFQRDQKLYKRGRDKYSDWAEREGFEYAVQKVPNNW